MVTCLGAGCGQAEYPVAPLYRDIKTETNSVRAAEWDGGPDSMCRFRIQEKETPKKTHDGSNVVILRGGGCILLERWAAIFQTMSPPPPRKKLNKEPAASAASTSVSPKGPKHSPRDESKNTSLHRGLKQIHLRQACEPEKNEHSQST